LVTTVDKSPDRVRDMFGEIAPKYDRMNHLLSMNMDKRWRSKTVRRLSPKDDSRILDVCCGTGDLAIAFAKATGGKAEVIACDFCPQMLTIGRNKQQKLNLSKPIEFVEADTQELPFDDNAFDIVSVAFGLRNVEDTDKGLSEMRRVCRPGGKVAILECTNPRTQPLRAFYLFYFRNILPRLGQLLARNSKQAYKYLPSSVGEFPAYEKLTERMLGVGMSNAMYFPMTFGVATLYVGTK
jgi:demethylmenaquinone methyltransferase / 2-methoxy-6-polyprenyl-1,4-benzoquinol methylase